MIYTPKSKRARVGTEDEPMKDQRPGEEEQDQAPDAKPGALYELAMRLRASDASVFERLCDSEGDEQTAAYMPGRVPPEAQRGTLKHTIRTRRRLQSFNKTFALTRQIFSADPQVVAEASQAVASARIEVQYILGQIPVNEKPVDSMLAKWLFERLKRVKFLTSSFKLEWALDSGDDVRDTWGGAARFGEMFATPTNIQAINLAIYYGLLEGNTLRAADCCKAYLQNPTVRLNKALYGHPLASAFWDLHLRQALIGDLGLEAVDGRPSVFMCPKTKLLVVIYVDDVLVSGPERHQDQFWAALKRKVELDEVEQLNQFIGRTHEIDGSQCVFNMLDYCQQAIDLYVEAAGGSGKVQFRKVSTPYVSDSLLTQEDYEVEGQVSAKASSVLMKLLWLTRLARPDLAYAVGSLATQVTRWSKNSDKQLFRLVSYLHSTQGLCLVSKVHDSPQSSTLDLFVDADLGGCPFTSKSTSGLFLVVKGPQGTFAPIAWSSRRQQHVARSTADAELNSLSEGLHEELLPAVMLLEKLLTPELSPKPIVHEDNSAVVQAIEKGYSIKLRHLARTPRLALASLHEAFTSWCQLRQTPTKDQLGDLFTKALAPCKFAPQAIGLEIWKTVPGPSSGQE
ncbi:unnamed protein product [Durusdinium trenchii]|uniref:Reverse transcriptase Ty1/copia-type domain-containing protein n=1 Tax=Durusdinium trenchii TaxID=1381693 RepID=A0ABP0HFY6_9DINO